MGKEKGETGKEKWERRNEKWVMGNGKWEMGKKRDVRVKEITHTSLLLVC